MQTVLINVKFTFMFCDSNHCHFEASPKYIRAEGVFKRKQAVTEVMLLYKFFFFNVTLPKQKKAYFSFLFRLHLKCHIL